MHLSPDREHRFRITRVSLFLVALGLTAFGIVGLATQAKAGPVTLKFDNARLDLGINKGLKILPAGSQFPSPDLPVPQRTDITLNGTETNGQLSFPAALNPGTQFPYMHFNHPLEKDLKVPLTFRLRDPGLTGTYDAATGDATLSGKMDLIIITGTGTSFPLPDGLSDLAVPPLGLFARCRGADMDVNLSTRTQAPITGQPFSGGFGVNGAMSGALRVPDLASENGGDCSLAGPASRGPGALWLSNGVVEPIPQPPTCREDSRLCPTVPYSEVSTVRVTPRKKTVRAGGKTKLKVRITNDGTEEASGISVSIKSPKRKVKAPDRFTVDVPAGGTAIKTLVVKARKKARGKAMISATANEVRGSAVLKIKPVK
ncbi:MAG TPA: hypothetical protein VMF31_04345 [Solirubrobacterales bacterium]|nr:hypothetical protein [Solirubrobacterales bacterium]